MNSTYVNQNLPEEEQMRHVASIGLPSTMADGEVLDLLSSIRQKWQGRSLVIHPGDQHDILTVMQDEKQKVTVSVAGRSTDRNP